MERSIEAADLWGGRRWEGSGKGKGRRESTSKRRKEGVKTGERKRGEKLHVCITCVSSSEEYAVT